MRLPDRYYDLVLDRDQLLEEEKNLLNQDYINLLEHMIIAYKINRLDKEIRKIENQIRG
jgi:hypothetical protein